MPAKRKRYNTVSSSKKRIKREDHISLDSSDVYEVEDIVGEKKNQYLVSWAPNKVTGETYEPTWEPKEHVNEAAVEDWEAKKAQQQFASKSPVEKRPKGRPSKKKGVARKTSTPRTQGTTSSRATSSPINRSTIPRASRKIPDTSPLQSSQQSQPRATPRNIKSSRPPVVEESTQETVDSTDREESPDPLQREIHIQPTQLRASQLESFSVHSSPIFRSSQVITGTAPQPDHQDSPDQPSTQAAYTDAAAAPDLTQKHSQYEHVDTSGSTYVTTSAEVTSSEHKLKSDSGHQHQPIVPDSQSLLASQSYEPPTQGDSKTTDSRATESNIVVNVEDDVEDISDWSGNSVWKTSTQALGRRTRGSPLQLKGASSSLRSIQSDSIVAEASSGSGPKRVRGSLSRVDSAPALLPGRSSRSDASATSDPPASKTSVPPLDPAPIIISSGASTRDDFEESQLSQQASERSAVRSRPRPTNSLRVSTGTSTPQRGSTVPSKRSPLSSEVNGGEKRTPRLGSPFRSGKQASARSDEQSGNTLSLFKSQISPTYQARSEAKAQIQVPDLQALLREVQGKKEKQVDLSPSREQITDVSSGSLRQPPSQWPETFASAPPRPETPSALSVTPRRTTPRRKMPSISPQSAPSETSSKIQELKDQGGPITPAQRSIGMTTRSANRAGSPAIMREARSPSAVPHAEVVPMPTEEENRTSERYLTLIPDKPSDAKRKKKTVPGGIIDEPMNESPAKSVQELQDTSADALMQSITEPASNEFVVPIFFLGNQRDHYKQTIIWKRKFLEEFMAQSWPENHPKYEEARQLIERLNQVTFHPDLMSEESFSQARTDPKDKAVWDKSVSAKFRFIGFLLGELAGQNLHVVIDVEAGRLFDILDNFLSGIGVQHVKAGSHDKFEDENTLRVTILPKHLQAEGVEKSDIVIGFEGALELIEDQRKTLRTMADGRIAPLMYLVVPKTVEHIERYLRVEPYRSMSASRRLTLLVENAAFYRSEAGNRQIHDQDSKNAAASIVRFITEGYKAEEWPIDELPDIQIKDPTSDSQATTASESTGVAPSTSIKRPLESDEHTETDAKKARTDGPTFSEIPSTIDPSALSLSAVSESAERQVVSASEYVSDMETLKHEYETRELDLQQKLSILQTRLDEHISALEELQYRHEEQRADLIKTRADRDSAYQSAALAAAQMSSRDTLVNKIKAERDEYKQQLAEAAVTLQSHVVPEIAAFEALKTQLADAEKEKTRLEARVKSTQSDLDYTRALYQDISSKGTALAEERTELATKVADLQKRAGAATQEALRMSRDAQHKTLRAEIRRLQLVVQDRERTLKAKDEEMARLREKERGRMGTRGGSVPRSPGRLGGSPMRLEPPRSHGPGSRATSPRRGSPAAGVIGGGEKMEKGRSRLGPGR